MTELIRAVVQKKKKRKKKKKHHDSSSSNSSTSTSSSDDHAKGMGGIHRERERMRKKPKSVIDAYRIRCMDELAITDHRQPWKFSDYTRKLDTAFGKLRGLWTCHWHISEALTVLPDKPDLAGAMLVQLLKALHQVALDGGSWQTATLFLIVPDPKIQSSFGGSSREQELAHQYLKAKNELLKAGKSFMPVHEPDGDVVVGGGNPTRAQKKAAAIAKAAAAKAAKEAKDG